MQQQGFAVEALNLLVESVSSRLFLDGVMITSAVRVADLAFLLLSSGSLSLRPKMSLSSVMCFPETTVRPGGSA